MDLAGPSWWIWDKKGEVLVLGKNTRLEAILTLGRGEEPSDEVDLES